MIDPTISLAFSLHSNKGAYALLLGSGISRASGIPTGWEVVLDLIRKIAKLENEDCEPDPAAWYRQKYNVEPDYGKLLDVVAKTPTERQRLLRGYFEPNEEERAQGLKAPSAAHKAIAQLVAAGHVRVIVTTNFDRLLEKAMEEAGVSPSVISTADQIAGALPLIHSGATIIKVHGDYLDTRIRNTDSELAEYEPAFNSLLDRVFDEFGLVVCGWSAEWDAALRAAIERCPSRRFTTFWGMRSPLAGSAKRLTDHRKAELLQIKNADHLFQTLWEKIRALDDMAAPHPLSSKIAVATAKRYLVDPAHKIRLRDLIHDETERLVVELTEAAFPAQTNLEPSIELNRRVEKYKALCETTLSLLVTGCYWGSSQHTKLWVDCLQRVAATAKSTSGLEYLNKLRLFPTLVLFYGACIAAIAGGNYSTLAELFLQAKMREDNGKDIQFCSGVNTEEVMEIGVGRLLTGMNGRHTPLSDYLAECLRLPLRDLIPGDEEFQSLFDRFEYLLALVYADQNRWAFSEGWRGPVGRFIWRGSRSYEARIIETIRKEIDAEGKSWAPLKAGLFGGNLDQANTAKTKFDAFLSRIHLF